jgi:uncharacterized RDD family membrane protein YckC
MPNDRDWYAPPASASSSTADSESVDDAEPEYAGFGVRAGARIIDTIAAVVFGMIGGATGGVIASVLAVSGVLAPGWLQRIQGLSVGSFGFGVLASLTYHTLSEGLGGASVGKALLGLRVKREGLRPCGVGRALVRNLAYYVDGFFFGMVAYSVMSSSERQQRLGDRWGHTVVVRASSLPAGAGDGFALGMALGVVGHVVVGAVSVVVRAL